MKTEYEKAMAKSYGNQDGGFHIPESAGITEVELGFQPLGLGVQIFDTTTYVGVAAYFEPAICVITFPNFLGSGMLGTVEWIRGVDHGVESVRLFAGHPTFGDKDRAQCVILNADGSIWVSRNGEREFFVLSTPKPNGRRTIINKFRLPSENMDDQIHAAYLNSGGLLHTIESTQSQDEWCRRMYEQDSTGTWIQTELGSCATFTYGLAQQPHDDRAWKITDFRSNNPKKGLYRGSNLVLPADTIKTASGHDGLCGNGLAFLANGDLLISRYGQAYPGCFNGIPGAILHVPASLLK